MSQTNEPEPVDAEFEPAPAEDAPKVRGTASMLVLFLSATLAGAALGLAGAWWLDGRGEPGTGIADPAEALAALDTRLDALEGADPAGTIRDEYAALRDRVERLESAPPVVLGEGDPQAFAALAERVSTLESAQASEITAYDDTALNERLDTVAGVAERAEALANQALDGVSALPAGEGVDAARVADLDARVAALESATPPDSPEVDLSALEARIAAAEVLAQDAAALAETLETSRETGGDSQSARTLAARTLALMALSEIAETSDPFEAERAALARLWRGRAELAALQPVARSGVPDRDTLASDFPRADIESAAGPSRAFFGLIEIRRTDASEDGDGPLALAALAEARLARGDLEGAVAASERLEGEPLEAARSWLLSAQARLQVEAALDSLRAALVEDAAGEGEDPR